jgi:uncharacterized protein YjbJ (UPF0337 family)
MLKGMFHRTRGTAKKFLGVLLSRKSLVAKGRLERISGKIHLKIGKVQETCGF